jgi:hypothetical protein
MAHEGPTMGLNEGQKQAGKVQSRGVRYEKLHLKSE